MNYGNILHRINYVRRTTSCVVTAALTLSPQFAKAETVNTGRSTLSAYDLIQLCSATEPDVVVEDIEQRQAKCSYYIKGVKDNIAQGGEKVCDDGKLESVYRRLVDELTTSKGSSVPSLANINKQTSAAKLVTTYLLSHCHRKGA